MLTQAPACEKCGYSLAGLGAVGSEAVCPECGSLQVIQDNAPPRTIGWPGFLLGIAAPWLFLPFMLCFVPLGVLAPPVFSLLVALGCSGKFRPVARASTQMQIGITFLLWAVVNFPLFITLLLVLRNVLSP